MLYSSPTGLASIQSLGHYFNPSDTLKDKLGLAGSCYELTASIPSVLSYFSPSLSESWSTVAKHEQEIQGTLLTYLTSRKDVTIIGEKSADPKLRVSTVSFVVEGWKSQDVVEATEKLCAGQIGFRWGGFYSNRLVEEVLGLGKDGVIRVSMVHYNTGTLSIASQFSGICSDC